MRYVVRVLIGLLALLLAALAVVTLLRIPLDVSRYKPMAESLLSDALGRSVAIDGAMVVTTSLWPYFELEGLRIANPSGFPAGDVVTLEQARVSIGLPPLLQRRLEIREFRVNGLTLDLLRTGEGEGNWVLEPTSQSAENAEDPNETLGESVKPAPDFLAINVLEFKDILVRFRDEDKQPLEFHLKDASGGAPLGEPMSLSMGGMLLEEQFNLQIKADSLTDFLKMTRTQLGVRLEIAQTRFQFGGLSQALRGGRGNEVTLSVEGADLSSLNRLLRLDLPPVRDYQLKATARSEPGVVELTSLDVEVGSSRLQGHMLIDRTGPKPLATLDLNSRHIQLSDFDTGEWSPEPTPESPNEEQTSGQDDSKPETETVGTQSELLSPDALTRSDARVTLNVDEVLSGEDRLGGAQFIMSLANGVIKIDPLLLKLPKSSLRMVASLKPDRRASDATLKLVIDNFDFGVLSRLSDPNSKAGGVVSVDIDVTASAGRTSDILSGANGYLDVSAELDNVKSGLVDLWAVNLLSAVVSSSVEDDEASQINCLISRFRLDDGVMTAEQVAVDTSRIRICGEGEIDFSDETFDLVATPRAKRPEFFSLATPVAVKGEFDDFRIGMKQGVVTLGTTATRFVVSPITTPLRRIFKKDLPEDGADVCSLPIGPRDQPLEPPPGC